MQELSKAERLIDNKKLESLRTLLYDLYATNKEARGRHYIPMKYLHRLLIQEILHAMVASPNKRTDIVYFLTKGVSYELRNRLIIYIALRTIFKILHTLTSN